MSAALRPAGPGDIEHVRWALYTAVSWDPARPVPPFGLAMEHPQLHLYHRDWMRAGDLGIIAELDGRVVGVAYCRLFTAQEHGHGYLDDQTPEIAIAVAEGHRGAGFGTRLLEELASTACRAGHRRLSLSVDRENPARRLYERAGYRVISDDEAGVRMVLDLPLG